ncbi:hypothetical protein [Microcoleus sp. D3_18_C4]|uniref:hypothetical protein n=1 Tax=Microcoleus sp. D3_18_C4 TaxID=3055335 RepID=UPI002FD69AEC
MEDVNVEYVHVQSFMITGTIKHNKSAAEIEAIIEHLYYLLPGNFCSNQSGRNLAVSGTFREEKKNQVDVVLRHLEKLLLEYTITADWRE